MEGLTHMVSLKSVEKQLKRIRFNIQGWNHAEAMELPNILMPDEKIFECVNGTYEGGVALLVATNMRLLLIDKKLFNFLNIEDARFDMINQIDYSHRLFGATISISAGTKCLSFSSLNQQRLRKLITHIQHRMAEIKKEQSQQANTQQQHLERINQQLQAYLLVQHQQQEELRMRLNNPQAIDNTSVPTAVRPDPKLADYLYAQRLLDLHQKAQTKDLNSQSMSLPLEADNNIAQPNHQSQNLNEYYTQKVDEPNSVPIDLYQDGMKEIYGKRADVNEQMNTNAVNSSLNNEDQNSKTSATGFLHHPLSNSLEINPLKIAYSKLPMVLRNREYGRRASVLRPSIPGINPINGQKSAPQT